MNTKNDLSEILIEYSALKFALFGIKPDFLTLYEYTHKKKPEDKKNLMQYVSNWKNTKHLKQLYNTTIEAVQAVIKNSRFDDPEEENKNSDQATKKIGGGFFRADEINFTDKNEFINYLNNQINLINDDKQRLDYLKILSDLLRFKEDQNKGTEEVQRFYLPLTCNNCKLYQGQKQNTPNIV